jgi:hypothetical protein
MTVTVSQMVKIFMECEYLLPCSQESCTGPLSPVHFDLFQAYSPIYD